MYAFTRYDINGKHYLMYNGEVIKFDTKEQAIKFADTIGITHDYIEEVTAEELTDIKEEA